jgi:peptide/nickel transport system permease protein
MRGRAGHVGPGRIGLNALIGIPLVGALLLTIGIGLFWMPYDPVAIDLAHPLGAPELRHWFGTDQFGRDVLSRSMLGARISVLIALATVVVAITVGTALGLLAGYQRGWTDRLLMMITDAVLAFPAILLALALIAVLGSSDGSIILALSIAYTPSVVRVVRATVLSVREREFIEASRSAGDSSLETISRHILPNVLPSVVVLATSLFGWAMLSESALSFLGVGVPPPAPTWGNMLSESRPYMDIAGWLSIVPGLCIAGTLLGVNLLGDALRDWLDPRRQT